MLKRIGWALMAFLGAIGAIMVLLGVWAELGAPGLALIPASWIEALL